MVRKVAGAAADPVAAGRVPRSGARAAGAAADQAAADRVPPARARRVRVLRVPVLRARVAGGGGPGGSGSGSTGTGSTGTGSLAAASGSTTTTTSTTTTSSNWSGYAAETSLNNAASGSVTAVSGTWKVPTATASSSTSTAYSSVWVGIDGYSSSSVEQIGTDSDIVNGQAQYYVWYEMYPSASVNMTSMTISAGDTINASVTYLTSGTHAGQFQLTITDASKTNDTFTIYETASSAGHGRRRNGWSRRLRPTRAFCRWRTSGP